MAGVRGAAVRASRCEAVGGVVTESYDGSVSGGARHLGTRCLAAGHGTRKGAYLAACVIIHSVISDVVAEFRRESSLP
jgi:hypothetical protein